MLSEFFAVSPTSLIIRWAKGRYQEEVHHILSPPFQFSSMAKGIEQARAFAVRRTGVGTHWGFFRTGVGFENIKQTGTRKLLPQPRTHQLLLML